MENIHVKFAKEMFSDNEAAHTYFRNFLPDKVARIIDFSTLRTTDRSYMREDMEPVFANLIFECRLIKEEKELPLHIALIWMHEMDRPKEEYMSIIVGHYVMSGYNMQVADKIDPLIPIIPLVYYHGE